MNFRKKEAEGLIKKIIDWGKKVYNPSDISRLAINIGVKHRYFLKLNPDLCH